MDISVSPLSTEEDLEALLPLAEAYQRFYEAEPNEDRNRRFFRRFLGGTDDGVVLGAWNGDRLVGFATIYWTFSSTRAAAIALLNDLFVAEEARKGGLGRALIDAAADAARDRGLGYMEWYTATDNERARRLYATIPGARRTAWYAYGIELT